MSGAPSKALTIEIATDQRLCNRDKQSNYNFHKKKPILHNYNEFNFDACCQYQLSQCQAHTYTTVLVIFAKNTMTVNVVIKTAYY